MDSGKLNSKVDSIAQNAIDGASGGPAPGIYQGPPSDPWRYIVTESGEVLAFKEGEGEIKTPNSAQREAILGQITDGTLSLATGGEPSTDALAEEPAGATAEDTTGDTMEGEKPMVDANPLDESPDGIDSKEARALMDAAPSDPEKVSLKDKDPNKSVPDQHRDKYGMVLPTPTTLGMLGGKIKDIAGRAWDKFNPPEDEVDASDGIDSREARKLMDEGKGDAEEKSLKDDEEEEE